jgi:hypothetical protein
MIGITKASATAINAGVADRSVPRDRMLKLRTPFSATHALKSTMAVQPSVCRSAPAQTKPRTSTDRIE